MSEIAFYSAPIYLWQPSASQWKRWVTARYKVSASRPYGVLPALERNMRWPLRLATVDDVFELVDDHDGDLAFPTHRLEPARERYIKRRLPAVAHPSLLRFWRDTPVAYIKAVRRLHLALRVIAARQDGLARLEWSQAQIPRVELVQTGKSYSLTTPLDAALIQAGNIEEQVEGVTQWLTREFRECIAKPVIVGPELIRPSRLVLQAGDSGEAAAPQVGIVTGVYGLAIMWLLQALQSTPNVGACHVCARPFQRIRGGRKAFCSPTCRSAHHRQRK